MQLIRTSIDQCHDSKENRNFGDKTHFLPAARAILDLIARLQFHLLRDRNGRVRRIIFSDASARKRACNGLGPWLIDSAHLARRSFSAALFCSSWREAVVVSIATEGRVLFGVHIGSVIAVVRQRLFLYNEARELGWWYGGCELGGATTESA